MSWGKCASVVQKWPGASPRSAAIRSEISQALSMLCSFLARGPTILAPIRLGRGHNIETFTERARWCQTHLLHQQRHFLLLAILPVVCGRGSAPSAAGLAHLLSMIHVNLRHHFKGP